MRSSGLFSLFVGTLCFLCTVSQSFTPPNMGGAMGCVVTSNRLFSHGYFIRELKKGEMNQMAKYKSDMAVFKKKIDEAFENAENVEASNSTVPPMPVKPSMPTFCTAPDTTLYIFGGCTIQNSKVYVGKTFARDLAEDEKTKLAEFARQTKESGKATAELQRQLEFCTEF